MAITLNSYHEIDLTYPLGATALGFTTVGNLLIAIIVIENTTDTITGATDNKGQAWTLLATHSLASTGSIYLLYKTGSAAGVTSLTLSGSGTATDNGALGIYDCGSTTGGALDQATAITSQTSANPAPALAVSAAGIAIVGLSGQNSVTAAAAPFTLDTDRSFGKECVHSHDVNGASGTLTCTFTMVSGTWNSLIVSFIEAAAFTGPFVISEDHYSQFDVMNNFQVMFDETMVMEERGIEVGFGPKSILPPRAFVDEAAENNISATGKGGRLTPDWFRQYESGDSDSRGIALGTGKEPRVPVAFFDESEAKYDVLSATKVQVDFSSEKLDEPGTLGRPPAAFQDEDMQNEIFVPFMFQPDDSDSFNPITPPVVAPNIGIDDEAFEFGIFFPFQIQPDDSDSFNPVTPPATTPNVGMDDIEAAFKFNESVALYDHTQDLDEPGGVPPPPSSIQDGEIEKIYDQRTVYDHTSETDEPGGAPTPPVVFADNEDLQKWVGWAVPAIEDDQSNLLQAPPQVIPDDADSSKWVGTLAMQHEDTDTNRVSPPPAPTVFSDNEDLQRWIGWMVPAIEDDQSNFLRTPPQVIPDDADSQKWTATLAVQYEDTETQRAYPPPPPEVEPETADDFEAQAVMQGAFRSVQGEDLDVTLPPPPPQVIPDDADAQKWTATLAIQHDDTDTNQTIPPPPPFSIQDGEIEKTYDQRTVYDATAEADEPGTLGAPPTTFTDDAEWMRWVDWKTPALEDDQNNSAPTPPFAITDDAESLIWTGKLFLQHEDPETQRAFPPPPPFSYEEEYKFLSGEIFKFNLEDEASFKGVTPPIVAPNIGMDDLETFMRAQDRVIPFFEDVEQTKTPRPPAAPVDESEQAENFGWKAAFEPDVEVERAFPPPPPSVLQDEISEAWKAWSQLYHDDLETQQTIPPPPPSVLQDEISEQWSDRRAIQYEDTETQRAFPPPPPPAHVDEADQKRDAGWVAPWHEDTETQRAFPPPPPTAQTDQAEDSQWVDTRFIQHDDTDTLNTLPPTPPAVPPKSIAEEILENWFATRQVYHEDAETQRALPPPPPFSYEEEYAYLSGQRATFYLDDSTGEAMVPSDLFARLVELLLASFCVIPLYDITAGFEAFVAIYTRSGDYEADNPDLSSDMIPAPADSTPVYALCGFEAVPVLSIDTVTVEPLFGEWEFERAGFRQ